MFELGTAAGSKVPDNGFVTLAPPAVVPGVRSVRVWLSVKAADELKEWLLTSEFEVEDALREVQVFVDVPDKANFPNTYRATAHLYFEDKTFEERVRLFPV